MPNTLLTVFYEFPVASLQIPITTRFSTLMTSLKVAECFSIFSWTKSTTNSNVLGDILNYFTHKSWNKRLRLLYHILSNHDWSYSIIQYLRLVGSIDKFIKYRTSKLLRIYNGKLFKIWKALRINSDLNRLANFFFLVKFWNRSSRVVFVFYEYPYQTITVYEILVLFVK